MARFDDIESRARLAFAEHALPRGITVWHGTLREKAQFAFRQPGENRDFGECLAHGNSRFRHDGYCIGARCWEKCVPGQSLSGKTAQP